VEISAKSGQIRGFKVTKGEEDKTATAYPFRMEAESTIEYFTPKEGFQISSLLKNPMIIMIGVTFLMILVIPRMMAGIDPEALQQELSGGSAQPREPPPKWQPSAVSD